MMVHKTSPGGTNVIDRHYSVGRIRRASGTKSEKLFRKLLAMLDELEAKPEYLRAIRDGRLKPLQVWASYQRYGLSRLPSMDEGRPISALMDWVNSGEFVGQTRRSYRSCANQILELAPRSAVVGDLPRLLAKYRDTARPRMFNLTRSTLRSFISKGLGLGHYHELYRDLSAVAPRKTKRSKGHPQTPDQAREIAEGLGRYGGMWWTLCCTGMSGGVYGPYFRDTFDVEPNHIEIHGTKRAGRERVVPRICTPVRALCAYKHLRNLLAAYGVSPNDGRRTYEAWLEAAGVPKARRRRYMGHGVEDMTDLYGDGYPMAEFLAEDAERVLRYIGGEFKARLQVLK